MQVRFLGFSFFVNGSALGFNDYVSHMITNHGQSHLLGEHNRFLFFNPLHSAEYYVGLLVTVKDQKTFCELVQNAGKLVVRVNSLNANSNLMDFNFFVIHKKTGLGMYQHYHQSCSVNSFGYFNNRRFSEFRDLKVNHELSSIPEHQLTTAKEKAVKHKYKCHLGWEILVRKEKLKDLIEEFKRVKSFEYSFASLTAEEPEFKPLKNYVRKESTKLSFSSESPVKALAGSISNIVTSWGIEDGKVKGIDQDGLSRVLKITNNPDNFGDYDYDDVAPKINALDVDKFEESWVVEELLKKCKEYKHIFEVPYQ